ncbi:MAG: hypothetical protein ACRCX8_16730 [Sarcina sp.]
MKIVANLPDINQLFNDGLKDIFPYSNIRVCVIHRVSGEILHIFRDIGKPIKFKEFEFNIKEHDLGLYIPSFYANRNWKSDEICEDSILTIGANTISFNGYDTMPIFIRPDGSVRKYVVVGLTRGVMDNGVLRSIPGRYPSSGYTIEEFRTAVRKGRDPKKWGLMNQDMFDCLQLLFKFAFQVTKTKEALGNGLGRENSLTGGTLVLGGQSGYTDPFQFGKDKPDARLKSLICVVDGRLQFSNWDGKFSPIKIANNKTLDECIVEETEDYIIYSDGEVTSDNPIPEGIYFACRVDKHTGEIYYGEGYENLVSSYSHTRVSSWGESQTFSPWIYSRNISVYLYDFSATPLNILNTEYIITVVGTKLNLDKQYPPSSNSAYTISIDAVNGNTNVGSLGKIKDIMDDITNTGVHRSIIESPVDGSMCVRSGDASLFTSNLTEQKNVTINKMMVVNGNKEHYDYVRTKCPTGKITQITDSSIFNSSLLIDNQEVNYTSLFSQTVTRDESDPTTILTPSNSELKITPIRPDLNQPYLDTFTENGIYPFNLMGRYILHKDTGEILERLSPFDSTLNFYGAPSIFDPSIHDIHTLFFPFYAKRSWKGEFLSDTMVFEIPKTTHRNGFEVMPIFRDANGNLRPFVSCGAFKGSVVDNQLRSLPEKLPVVSLTIDQARTYARTNRDSKFNIETLDFITMVQFLYKIAFQDLNSQKIIGNGWTNKSDKVKTGATMWIGNKSGSHDNPFFNGDMPDSRLRASLVYVNDRLEYYTDPNEPIEIEIANNKTLDECIVEETEDYIIYSDGEVTPDNPIPEGIYFACRVDKHTGEIYYGEGYENSPIWIGTYGFGNTKKIYEDEKILRYSIYGTALYYRGVVCLTTRTSPVGSTTYIHDTVNCRTKLLLNGTECSYLMSTTNISVNSSDIYSKQTQLNDSWIEHDFKVMWSPSAEQTHGNITLTSLTNVNEGDIIEDGQLILEIDKKFTYAKNTTTIKPYVKTKCPQGKIKWKSNTSDISHLTHSFIFKNLKIANRQTIDPDTGVVTHRGATYMLDTMSGECYGVVASEGKIHEGSAIISNSTRKHYATETPRINIDTNFSRRLSITANSSETQFNRYKSMTGFYIYKGDFTEAEFNTEISKNIKPVSVSRAKSTSNGNQISLFGIEDFYGNIWSFVDGAVIKDSGLFYTMNPNDYGFNGDRYNEHIVFTPPMGVNPGEYVSGYIKNIQKADDFINYPKEINAGSSTNYYSSQHFSHRLGMINILMFGGRWANNLRSGCFNWYCEWVFSNMNPEVSCRLTYLPEGIPNTNTEEV